MRSLRGAKCTSLVDQQFSYVRFAAPLIGLVGISIEFCGAISSHFCFSYALGASLLCRAGYTLGSHAFLVFMIILVIRNFRCNIKIICAT